MIFHTPLTVTVPGAKIGTDSRGNPIYGPPTVTTMRGEFRPLGGSEEADRNSTLVTSRFRVYLPPTAVVAGITNTSTVRVLGKDYKLVGNPEPHNVAGRVHHYEVVAEKVATS